MPPRLHLFSSPAAKTISSLTRPSRHAVKPAWYSSSQARRGNDDKIPEQPTGPNQDVLPHVSEEQAAIDKIMGEEPPDLSQGTPVEDVSIAGYFIGDADRSDSQERSRSKEQSAKSHEGKNRKVWLAERIKILFYECKTLQ